MCRQGGCSPCQSAQLRLATENGVHQAAGHAQASSLAPARTSGGSAVGGGGGGAGSGRCAASEAFSASLDPYCNQQPSYSNEQSPPLPAAVLLLSPAAALAEAAPASSSSSSGSMSISFAPKGFKQAMDDCDEAMRNKCPGGMMDCEWLPSSPQQHRPQSCTCACTCTGGASRPSSAPPNLPTLCVLCRRRRPPGLCQAAVGRLSGAGRAGAQAGPAGERGGGGGGGSSGGGGGGRGVKRMSWMN